MAVVFRQLFVDFFSTIVFLVVYAATGDIIIATAVAILAMALIAPVTRRFTGAFSYLPVTLLAGAMVSVLVSFAVRVVEPADAGR